ncbi:MAG: type IV pilin protein [Agarilytica sp.]
MSHRSKGFSLIELLIIVAIVAILTAISVPSYRSYVQKTCRNEAKSAILEVVAMQEKHYFQNNTYAALDGLGFSVPLNTPEGCYVISVVNDEDTYEITATSIGAQLGDTNCTSFSMDHLGQKTALGGASNPTDVCW